MDCLGHGDQVDRVLSPQRCHEFVREGEGSVDISNSWMWFSMLQLRLTYISRDYLLVGLSYLWLGARKVITD